MHKTASEARILELAKKLNIKIITKKEDKDDRERKDATFLPVQP